MKGEKGLEGLGGGGRRDKRSESQACAGMLRIGRHVNLNPLRERRKTRRKGEQGTELEGGGGGGWSKKKEKERDVRSLSSCSLLHPLSV